MSKNNGEINMKKSKCLLGKPLGKNIDIWTLDQMLDAPKKVGTRKNQYKVG